MGRQLITPARARAHLAALDQERTRHAMAYFAERLEQLGYKSLSDFARENDLQKSSVSRWFRRERHMQANHLIQIAAALQIKPEKLLRVLGYEF